MFYFHSLLLFLLLSGTKAVYSAEIKPSIASVPYTKSKFEDYLIQYGNNSEKLPVLHAAIKNSDYDAVIAFLENGLNPNKNSTYGFPLEIAIRIQNKQIVRTLLEYGATFSCSRSAHKSLAEISRQGDLDISKLLLLSPNFEEFNTVRFIDGCLQDEEIAEDIIWLLIQNCSDLFTEYKRDADTINLLTPAVERGDISIILWLIQHGLEMNRPLYCQLMPFFIAVQKNRGDIVKLLYEHGAVLPRSIGGKRDIFRSAFLKRNFDILFILFDMGIQVDATSEPEYGELKTVLILAIESQKIEVISELLVRGANTRGCLRKAAAIGNREIITLLIDCGASIEEEIVEFCDVVPPRSELQACLEDLALTENDINLGLKNQLEKALFWWHFGSYKILKESGMFPTAPLDVTYHNPANAYHLHKIARCSKKHAKGFPPIYTALIKNDVNGVTILLDDVRSTNDIPLRNRDVAEKSIVSAVAFAVNYLEILPIESLNAWNRKRGFSPKCLSELEKLGYTRTLRR